jgi:hypothetical protein
MISGDRMEKRPLTHRPQSFAVRHRLLQDSLTSPFRFGPFVVELFAAGGFAAGPRTSHVRFGLSPGTKLPTSARLNEALSIGLRTPWTGLRTATLRLTRFEHDGLRWRTSKDCPHRPQSSESAGCGVSDRMLGLLCMRLSAKQRQPNAGLQDYSNKPPSNWTNQSPGIQLYGPIT